MNTSINQGYIFNIERTDVDYVKYLYKSYHDLIKCAYEDYFKMIKNEDGMDQDNYNVI